MSAISTAGAFLAGLAGGWYVAKLNGKGIPGWTNQRRDWSIGIYSGPSPFDLGPAREIENPVLTARDITDLPAQFVADPFMIHRGGTWHMFFEVFPSDTQHGVIALATSDDGLRWTYRQVVLRERYHLAYPYVFEWDGELWMVPDGFEPAEVRLYRATDFPTGWTYHGSLVRGISADSSLVRYAGRWWMFVCSTPYEHHTLRLYYADDLTGPWSEHPASPLLRGNPHFARPAGRVLELDGRLVRFAQDSGPIYGRQVWAFEVLELTPESYRERLVRDTPVLAPGSDEWNRLGMHQIDPHQVEPGRWIACVDGQGERWVFDPRSIRLLPSQDILRRWPAAVASLRRRIVSARQALGGKPGLTARTVTTTS